MKRYHRRTFLRAASGACLAIPALPSLFGTEAAAGGLDSRKRFVSIRSSQGPNNMDWFPSVDGLAPSETTSEYTAYDLADIVGPVSPIFGSAFDDLRSQMLFLQRLDPLISQQGHNLGVMLGGFSDEDDSTDPWGLSIDQVMAQHVYDGVHPQPYLNLMAKHSIYNNEMHSFGDVGGGIAALTGIYDPRAVFDQLFLAVGDGQQEEEFLAEKAREQLAVDRVLEEYQALRGGPRIGSGDRQALDTHIEFLFELESRIDAMEYIECAVPDAPASRGSASVDGDDMQPFTEVMMDLMVGAIRCDLTRVLNLGMYYGHWMHLPTVSETHHSLAHDGSPGALAQLLVIDRFLADRVAYFLHALDAEVDPINGNTLLQNTVVFYSKEMANSPTHPNMNVPVLLAGGCDGYFRTGRLVDYASDETIDGYRGAHGRAYNDLLVTLMLAMDLTPQQWEQQGQPGFGAYSYTSAAPEDKTAKTDQRSPMPGATV